MAVKNYQAYTVNAHAKNRILTRFNITGAELDKWLTRLLSQATFVEKQDNGNSKYRLNDIVVITNPRSQEIVTVFGKDASETELDSKNAKVIPEVKVSVVDAMNELAVAKKRWLAQNTADVVENMGDTLKRMTSPHANVRYLNANYDIFLTQYDELVQAMQKVETVLHETQQVKDNL